MLEYQLIPMLIFKMMQNTMQNISEGAATRIHSMVDWIGL